MDNLTLRDAGTGDGALVARLWASTFDDKFLWVLGDGNMAFLEAWLSADPTVYAGTELAQLDGETVGYVQTALAHRSVSAHVLPLLGLLLKHYGPCRGLRALGQFAVTEADRKHTPDDLHICMIGVAPEHRGKGIAWTLLDYCEAYARARRKRALTLGVVEDNAVALKLYERFGFVAARHVRSRIVHWASGHTGYYEMRKDLTRKPA